MKEDDDMVLSRGYVNIKFGTAVAIFYYRRSHLSLGDSYCTMTSDLGNVG